MKSKVVIVGAGFVGLSYSYALINQGTVEEIVIIDINKEKAKGEVMDLNHGLPFAPRKMTIRTGDYKDCQDAPLVVISAGVNQKEGETRLDLLKRNAVITKSITKNIMDSGFDGIILMASNPVDIMTQIVYEASGLPSRRVIGSGTSLDTARLRYEISKQVKIDSRNIHAYILGEHGDSEFVCWSNAYIGAKPLKEVIETLTEERFNKMLAIEEKVIHAAKEIISRKGSTYYGIGMSLVRITAAIFNNENRIIPLSVLNNNNYDCENIYIGLPAIINQDGIREILELKLSKEEIEKLKKSASILKEARDSIQQ